MKVDAYFDNRTLPHRWFALIYDDTHTTLTGYMGHDEAGEEVLYQWYL